MKRLLMILLMAICLCGNVQAQQKPSFKEYLKEKAFIASVAATAVDFGVSTALIDGKKYVELNPLWRKKNGRFNWQANGAYSVAYHVVIYFLYRYNPKLGRIALYINVGGRAYGTLHTIF